MAHRFMVPDSSPAGSPTPSTPDKRSQRGGFSFSQLGDNPTTTPAGPPPSSQASFTPAGAPSDSYLGSSIMRGVTGQKPLSFGQQSQGSTGRNLFGGGSKSNSPLGRSIGPSHRQRSGLSQGFSATDFDDEDEDAEGEDEDEGEEELPQHRGSLFRVSNRARDEEVNEDAEEDPDHEIERLIENDMNMAQSEESTEDSEEYEDEDADGVEDPDLFLNMRHDDRAYGQPMIGEEPDELLNNEAATNRMMKEATDIFKRTSAVNKKSSRNREFHFATIAKDFYSQHDVATVTEPTELIVQNEDLVCRLYDEGVGPEEDEEKLENSLADATGGVCRLWNQHIETLPQPEGEEEAAIGPGPSAGPFENAAYVAQLLLRMHHNRFEDGIEYRKAPQLPDILFNWMDKSHNPYPDVVQEVARYTPSPASHSLFWETVRVTLLRGHVSSAALLLKRAGFEHARRRPRGDYVYTGQALENVQRFSIALGELLEQCPGASEDWDIGRSAWTLFRVRARGLLDQLRLFAEGGDASMRNPLDDSYLSQSAMSTMARKASSQIPWEVYEALQMIYSIILGDAEAIVETAQDWCEATVGLMGWWDDGSQGPKSLRLSQSQNLLKFSTVATIGPSDESFNRLAAAFHLVLKSELSPNPLNQVEIAVASAFEGNVNAVIGFLRTWSLPIACTVAEIASLGKWLPAPETSPAPLPTDTLDADDLALLGISQPTADDMEGIKDTTLVVYARELAGIEHLSPQKEGWEMAIQVLGRMDVPEKSEDTVRELLRDLLTTLDVHSGKTVDKIWVILNDLGMMSFAEETAESFAELLSRESMRFGEALWYYALAHRPNKVREVLNLLIALSLLESTAYPAEKDLDDDLKNLLRKRGETLEQRAKQDLDAAQLLGRMLSGYATLRKFYEIRDEHKMESLSSRQALALKRQAATALMAVISSADDNIRGGLYDANCDAVVSEEFLLTLLGEATVFVHQSPPLVTLDQIDVLLKGIEDLQTVGTRIYSPCDEMFTKTLSSAQGLKGSTPSDLMTKSTTSLSGSSYIMTGSSMLASQMHKSVSGGAKVVRGWDWRKSFTVSTTGEQVLGKLRLGLAKDLASLWLTEADGDVPF